MRSVLIRLAATLAAAATVGFLAAGTGAGDAGGLADRTVTVRDAQGEPIARVPLTGDRFAVGYRNSIYGTLAEEHYRVGPDGRFRVVQLAADQLAVLEEYYAVPGPPRPAPPSHRRVWVAEPARSGVFDELSIAATELGERTLHVPGREPVPLPPLAGPDPIVVLTVEEMP